MTEKPSECWQGTPASPGLAGGRARVVRTPSDLAEGEEEDILLARNGTPALLPAVIQARAVVCEKGGVLSHLAILARELGKPCVIGVPGILDAVQPGTWIVVDGTAGTVSVESANRRPASADLTLPAPPATTDGMVPLLQYGLYTTTFERTEAAFDVQTVVRVAALASIPSAFGLGAPWNVTVRDGVVSVPEASHRATVDALVSRIEDCALDTRTLRSQSRSLVSWPGWARLRADRGASDSELLGAGLSRYVAVNRLAWAASLGVEPLATRYRAFLWDRLGGSDEEERQRLFLDSLIMPGSSYMLRSALGEESSLWPTPDVGDGELAAAVALAELGRRRGEAAQGDLASLLGQRDASRAAEYVSALTDLVHLTEDKNTGRHACGRALFGSDAQRAAIAAHLHLDEAPSDPAAAVGAVLHALEGDLDAGLGHRPG
jgi:phosphohistidine swiveling domain-containing protein